MGGYKDRFTSALKNLPLEGSVSVSVGGFLGLKLTISRKNQCYVTREAHFTLISVELSYFLRKFG